MTEKIKSESFEIIGEGIKYYVCRKNRNQFSNDERNNTG
jgi:hypothetical protein